MQIGTNIPKYLESAMIDPHILTLGDRLNPSQFFVVTNGKALEKPTLLSAVDSCFKFFYIMDIDIEYPWECHTCWEFLQKSIFKLEGKSSRKTSPSVIAMRTALKN